jgi:hypothetical protein
MRKRTRLILFGLLISAAFAGLLILGLITDINRGNAAKTRQATVNSIYMTNSAVALQISECDDIALILGLDYACGGWHEGRTRTPTPTDPSLPTLGHIEVLRTANQRTQQAFDRVLTACARIKNAALENINPCPTIWAAMTPAWNTIAPSVTPTPSTR